MDNSVKAICDKIDIVIFMYYIVKISFNRHDEKHYVIQC